MKAAKGAKGVNVPVKKSREVRRVGRGGLVVGLDDRGGGRFGVRFSGSKGPSEVGTQSIAMVFGHLELSELG